MKASHVAAGHKEEHRNQPSAVRARRLGLGLHNEFLECLAHPLGRSDGFLVVAVLADIVGFSIGQVGPG
jgi:hypothetical protein